MAFIIKNITGANTNLIELQLHQALNESRFSACLTNTGTRIEIRTVRLNQAKDYCGNHPYACPVRPGGHRPHKKLSYLEGADWVAFNDMLNDILDILNVSANVASSLCIIRKGASRRTEYHGHALGQFANEWNKDTDASYYVDRRNRITPRSLYPKDTPGIDAWKKDVADSRPEMLHTH